MVLTYLIDVLGVTFRIIYSISDFELAINLAFKWCVPGATVFNCFFHLRQSAIRKANTMGVPKGGKINKI